MLGPSMRPHVVVEHVDDDARQPSLFRREDPLAAMHRGMAIREGVDGSTHLECRSAGARSGPVCKPLDPALDEVTHQVAQPQLVIVTSQEEEDQIGHKLRETAMAETPELTRPG